MGSVPDRLEMVDGAPLRRGAVASGGGCTGAAFGVGVEPAVDVCPAVPHEGADLDGRRPVTAIAKVSQPFRSHSQVSGGALGVVKFSHGPQISRITPLRDARRVPKIRDVMRQQALRLRSKVDMSRQRIAKFRDGQPVIVPITATFTPTDDDDHRPAVTIEVDVVEGRPVIVSCTLTGTAEHPLASDAVRIYSLTKLASHALTSFTVDVSLDGHGYVPSDTKRSRESIISAVKQRHVVGADRLAEVLANYEAGGVKAVEKNLAVSRSQAYRLIAQAKQESGT